ncbi:MAG: M20/M25/M40 family metallo-hydrolase [Dehalococcoidia bacterium]|nr:M20/M25/M40 family metallo-hydrolase [Dehalococcoidia bacterium]
MPRRAVPAGPPTPLAEIVRAIVSIPSTSFLEQGVHAALRRFAEARGLAYREVAGGNGVIEYRRGRGGRPLVLGAHTDHPGFVVTAVAGRRIDLEFRGGLSAAYGAAERLRLYAPDGADRGAAVATITAVRASAPSPAGARRIEGATARLAPGAAAAVGDLALWDVDACRIRGQIVHARQCDDLIGVVAVLATLDRMAASGASGHVIGLFTRAEEVGLIGAAAVARAHALPAEALVVAVECSSMAGGRAEQGAGPIIRVGDIGHVFSPRVTMWMGQIARELAAEDVTAGAEAFRYQRKLMDGGTTEATAYDLLGYETGAACVALGNYHNAGPRGRVAAETVHLGDVDGLARLFERMARDTRRVDAVHASAVRRWRAIGRDAVQRLRPGSDL